MPTGFATFFTYASLWRRLTSLVVAKSGAFLAGRLDAGGEKLSVGRTHYAVAKVESAERLGFGMLFSHHGFAFAVAARTQVIKTGLTTVAAPVLIGVVGFEWLFTYTTVHFDYSLT